MTSLLFIHKTEPELPQCNIRDHPHIMSPPQGRGGCKIMALLNKISMKWEVQNCQIGGDVIVCGIGQFLTLLCIILPSELGFCCIVCHFSPFCQKLHMLELFLKVSCVIFLNFCMQFIFKVIFNYVGYGRITNIKNKVGELVGL